MSNFDVYAIPSRQRGGERNFYPIPLGSTVAVQYVLPLPKTRVTDLSEAFHDEFMERYGFPLAILTVVTVVMPTLSVVLMLIMPGIIVIGGGIGSLFGLFVWLQKVRERHLLEEIWRLMVQKKGENE